MSLKEFLDVQKNTYLPPKADFRDLIVGFDVMFTTPCGSKSYIGNGTLITNDGWVLSAAHVFSNNKQSLLDQTQSYAYTSQDEFVCIEEVILGSDVGVNLDIALVKTGLRTTPFSINFSQTYKSDSVYVHSYLFDGYLQKKGKVVSSQIKKGDISHELFPGSIMTDAHLSSGQSGSAFINSAGDILGVATADITKFHNEDISLVPFRSFGPSSKQIIKFLRAVYRSQK